LTEAVSGSAVFQLPIRVYIEDTDAGGIVFHAKYLHYMERARTEWVRSRGIHLRAGLSDNVSYVVQKLAIHFARPGKLDDQLLASAELVRCGRVWMEFEQQVTREKDGELLASATVKVACVALDTGRPRALPESIRALAPSTEKRNNQE